MSLRPFKRRNDGCEILREAARVIVQKLFDALKFRRAHDEAHVVSLLEAMYYLFVRVIGRVRVLLPREAIEATLAAFEEAVRES